MDPRSLESERSTRLAVRAARLFDGDVLHDTRASLVLIEGGRIVDVDFTGAQPPADASVRDLGDATLLPGLIDTHAHLVFDASMEAVAHVQSAAPADLLEHMRAAATSMLACGVTTVRDLGDRDYLSLTIRDELASRPDAGPTIVAAGPPLTPTGGHCWFLGGCADGIDGLTAAVRDHAERGVDVIKVMTTGGRMTPTTLPHESQYTLAELRAVATAAHGHGLPIAGHAHGRQGIADALAAGFDTLEHVSFMTADGFAPDQRVIEAIAESGTIASITPGAIPDTWIPPQLAAAMPALLASMVHLHECGVRLTLGPDGGIAPAKPHHVLPYAISGMVDAGLPVDAALRAVTTTAAAACRVDRHAGRIAAGYDADLLAVPGNLFADIGAIHRPVAIYRHGHAIR